MITMMTGMGKVDCGDDYAGDGGDDDDDDDDDNDDHGMKVTKPPPKAAVAPSPCAAPRQRHGLLFRTSDSRELTRQLLWEMPSSVVTIIIRTLPPNGP